MRHATNVTKFAACKLFCAILSVITRAAAAAFYGKDHRMNPFTTGGALIKAAAGINHFNKHYGPGIRQARAEGDFAKARELQVQGTSEFARNISPKLKITYDIYGQENIPEDGPVLIVPNHQGYADILLMYYIFQKMQTGFVAKQELSKVKLIQDAAEFTGTIFLNRGDTRGAIEVLREGAERLKRGDSLVIFPEGTRSKGGPVRHFKAGSLKFAQKAKVPILPVSIEGTYHTFEEYGSFHPAHYQCMIHPLVHIEEMDRREQATIHTQIEETVFKGLEELTGKKVDFVE